MLGTGARLVAQTIKTFVLGVCAASLLVLATIGVPHALSAYCRLPPANDDDHVRYVSPQCLVRCCLLSVLVCALGVRWIGPNVTFHAVSFWGLLFAPFAVLGVGNTLFNVIWFLFGLQLAHSLHCIRTNLGRAYLQFLWVFRLCFALALAGLVMFCAVVVVAFADVDSMFTYAQRRYGYLQESVLLLCYGGYFGVLHRDAAQMFHRHHHHHRRTSVPRYCCALCQQPLVRENDAEALTAQPHSHPNNYQLECHHAFHQPCLRGYSVFGKRECCPACGERSGKLAELYDNIPWEKTSLDWIHYLHMVKHLVLYAPVVLHLWRWIGFALTGLWYQAAFNDTVWF